MKRFTRKWYECLQEQCGMLAYLADKRHDSYTSRRMYMLNGYIDERINRQ